MEAKVSESDHELVAQAKDGEFAAFEKLVSRYERRVFAVVLRIAGRREIAEDIVQDTFASVIEHLPQFREEASFYTWLMRIAVNHALKRSQKERRWITGGDHDLADTEGYSTIPHPEFIAPWRDRPEQAALRSEMQELLTKSLEELDEKYRAVFVLRDIEERSTAEAAELLGISEANVKVRLLRARLQLRERITRALGDESRQLIPSHEHHE